MTHDPKHDRHDFKRAAGVIPLSPAGLQRREAMRGELIGEMDAIHRRRRIRRRATLIGAPILAIGIIVSAAAFLMPPNGPRGMNAQHVGGDPGLRATHDPMPLPEQPTRIAAVVIEQVRTDPTIVDRWRAQPQAVAAAQIIDDEELLSALCAINRCTGLVRSGGKVWLTANVLDPAGPATTLPGDSGSS